MLPTWVFTVWGLTNSWAPAARRPPRGGPSAARWSASRAAAELASHPDRGRRAAGPPPPRGGARSGAPALPLGAVVLGELGEARVVGGQLVVLGAAPALRGAVGLAVLPAGLDRKSTRLNSSHVKISYAVFCLKKKT